VEGAGVTDTSKTLAARFAAYANPDRVEPRKPDALVLRRVLETLPRFTYRFTNEVELHKALALVLAGAGLEFEREHVAGPADRFDFLLPSGIVIEAKVKGSMTPALSQCARYLAREDVSAVVLVTTRYWAAGGREVFKNTTGKPLHTVKVRGASF
jgi:hypothetical protein